jgi:integrase
MFFTGTRPGEAMALKFSDLQGDYIYINKTMNGHGNREIDTPKTYSSIRKIRIDKVLKNDLLALKKYYEKVYNCSNIDFFMFGGLKPLAPTTINRYKIKACQKANLRPITLHQFRHSHATLLLHNGIIVNEISRRLGHSNPSITLNIYTHTDLSQEKRVSTTLNSLRFNLFNTMKYKFKQFVLYIITRIFARYNHNGADEGI